MEKHEKFINEKRDWSDLPSDIVYLIAKKLPDFLDFVRFHSTCKNWRASTPLSDFPLHFPWLLEFHQNPNDPISAPTTRLRLYNILSGQTLTIPIKESRWFRGISHHYIPFLEDHTAGTISLFNPLTNDQFVPPPINESCELLSCWMVWTGSSPIRNRKILIVDCGGYVTRIDRWAIYDPHHANWSEQKAHFNNFCYCQGMLFSTYIGTSTQVFDVSSRKLLYRIPALEIENFLPGRKLYPILSFRRSYVVESCGEILRVFWYYEKDNNMEAEFHIYRLNSKEVDEQHFWVRISDIGDQNLFLEVRNGFSMTAAPSSGLRGGRIYFIDPYDGKPYVHDIVANTIKTVSCPFKQCTWFVPGLC